MKNLELLDEVLLSKKVFENFKTAISNPEFSEWLTKIVPEIVDCANQKQDNPWHIYGCLEHILRSVDEVNKQTVNLTIEERKLLAYSMFYHDMGKPASHIRRFAKAYGREVDSFFNHNKKSAEIVRRTAAEFGFDEQEIKQIEKLVLEHDIFMSITDEPNSNPHKKALSNELIVEQMDELSMVGDGKKFMQYLIMIGRADNLAQNPEMTGKSLGMLDKMEHMTNEIEYPVKGVELQ